MHVPGKKDEFPERLKLNNDQCNCNLSATGYIEMVCKKQTDFPHCNLPTKPCQVLSFTGKKTFIHDTEHSQHDAEACKNGTKTVLIAVQQDFLHCCVLELRARSGQFRKTNSSFTDLARLLFINALSQSALNSRRARMYKNLTAGPVTNHRKTLTEKWECII